nr:MAG TPA: hypothetical protein [Caudoviricetes sp.]
MYDSIYNIPVNTIGILDRKLGNMVAPYDLQEVRIVGLDRKAYITQEQFFTYFVGGVIDGLVVI